MSKLEEYYQNVVLKYEGDECLTWPYATTGYGYGKLFHKGKNADVHRRLCEDVHGPPPDGYYASHSCGLGHLGCVTKRHIRWKSPRANQMERFKHGTMDCQSKLTEEDVRHIRELKGRQTAPEVARKYGVNKTTIRNVWIGKTWKHVTGSRTATASQYASMKG